MPGLGGSQDPMIRILRSTIRWSVKALALFMTLLIVVGVIDVAWTLKEKMLTAEPRFVLSIGDILATFGAFMAVLIAIEIFVNIIMYLEENVIHVKIVMATALMAVARKVITLDFKAVTADYIWSTAAVVLATSIGYWLLSNLSFADHFRGLGREHQQPPREAGAGAAPAVPRPAPAAVPTRDGTPIEPAD